jgi:ribonuclease BN (tRNA processing enzyme)
VQLTVLGCAGTFPGPDSPCSSYLVEHDGFRLVVDMGAGSLGPLQKHLGLLDVDAIYISHLHADHCIDLVAYSYARRYHPGGVPPRLPVYGPKGTGGRICGAFENPPLNDLIDVFDFHEVDAGPEQVGLQLGPFAIRSAVTNHPIECHALRLEAGGRSLTYSGDTGTSDPLVELATDTDVFLCEASWEHAVDNPPGVHLSGTEAGEHARRARARRLLLTHVVPWADGAAITEEARAAYAGEVELARSGATYRI